MPELYNNIEMQTTPFYLSYLQAYMERSLPDELDINNEIKFENFLMLLASNTGEELVYGNYSKQLGISSTTIKAWVSVLKNGDCLLMPTI